MTLRLTRSPGSDTRGMIKRDAGVMEGQRHEMGNEVADRSPGRNKFPLQ